MDSLSSGITIVESAVKIITYLKDVLAAQKEAKKLSTRLGLEIASIESIRVRLIERDRKLVGKPSEALREQNTELLFYLEFINISLEELKESVDRILGKQDRFKRVVATLKSPFDKPE
jgi:hypothetical protein